MNFYNTLTNFFRKSRLYIFSFRKNGQEAVKGREVLVEGVIEVGKDGKFFVRGDWMEKGGLAKEAV